MSKHPPDVSVLCCVINICGDGHDSSVDVIHHVCPRRARHVVQQQGVQLGYPTPVVDCDGGVGLVSHQLRRCDGHLHHACEGLVTIHQQKGDDYSLASIPGMQMHPMARFTLLIAHRKSCTYGVIHSLDSEGFWGQP